MDLSLNRGDVRAVQSVLLCGLLTLGCSANSLNDGGKSEYRNTGSEDSGTVDDADTAMSPDEADVATWFGLGGSLTLSGERISVELEIELYGENSDAGVICTISSGAIVTELIAPTPDESIALWWNSPQFEKARSGDCAGADRLPTQVQLGVGSIHEALLPYLRARGLQPNSEDDAILGTYIGFNDPNSKLDEEDTAYLLGYATPLNTENESPDQDALHGNFALSSVFLHPLETLTDTGLGQD